MSASLTTQQLTELLHTAADLETAIYTLDQAIPKTKKQIEKNTPKKPEVERVTAGKKPREPKKAEPPLEPVPPKVPAALRKAKILQGAYACGGVAFLVAAVAASAITVAASACCIAGIAACAFGISTNRKQQKAEAEKYQQALNAYQQEAAAYPRLIEEFHQKELQYPQELEQYQRELDIWKDKENEARVTNKARSAAAQESYLLTVASYQKRGEEILASLEKHLKDSQENLESLYTMDWLYPKYRTLPAVTTIYEYFLSGRCTELTGPDGAYNLYESELRQNIIIEKLENIEKKLDQIQQNQFLLYTEMKRANQISQEIAQDTKAILSQTKEIAWNTKCTAYFSEVTAKNTEAIKILTFLNGAS